MRVTASLVEYINVCSEQICTTTHKNNLIPLNLNPFCHTLAKQHEGGSFMQFQILRLTYISKIQNILTKHFKSFPFAAVDVPQTTRSCGCATNHSQLWMYHKPLAAVDVPQTTRSCGCTTNHSPGMNKKTCGTGLILRPSPQHCGVCLYCRKLDHKDTARRFYRPVHEITKAVTEHFCRKEANVQLLSNDA